MCLGLGSFFFGLDSDYGEYDSDTESLNGSGIFAADICGETEEYDRSGRRNTKN